MPRSRVHGEQRPGELGGLGAIEARRRLVEQEQLRLRHERPADLHQPPDAEAERLDRAIGNRRQPEQVERRLRSCSFVGGGLTR